MENLDGLTFEDMRLILSIVEEGSLTAGAARMNINQSNASYALKKIQTAFQAELFFRKGRKLIPSEFGWHVYHHTKNMFADFQNALHPPQFDPTSNFTLNFGATEYETITIFPQILKALKEKSPNAKINIKALDTTNYLNQMEQLDFAFSPIDIASSSIKTKKILTDEYVTIYDKTIQEAPTSLAKFIKAKHAIVSFDGSATTITDRVLASKGLTREITMSVFGFSALAGLMQNSNNITTLPKRIANKLFSNLATVPCPLNIKPMPLYICWEVAKEQQGKIRWFNELIDELFESF